MLGRKVTDIYRAVLSCSTQAMLNFSNLPYWSKIIVKLKTKNSAKIKN